VEAFNFVWHSTFLHKKTFTLAPERRIFLILPPDSRSIVVGKIKWRINLIDDDSVGLNVLGERSKLRHRQHLQLNDAVSDCPEVKSVILQRVDRPRL
jgi:hypothetical protein